MSWSIELPVAFDSARPRFLQIAQAVADEIRRGRLKPGAGLPGTRTLAAALGVHRNTVTEAYAELASEGWVTTHARGATRVSAELPEKLPRRFAVERPRVPSRTGFDFAAPAIDPQPQVRPGTLRLAGGIPDLERVPTEALARAYRRALKRRSLLGYADPAGEPALRERIAEMLSSLRSLAASGESILITRGSHQALDLTARLLLSPGDRVAVEALGYRPAWRALRSAGATLEPVAIDEGGLRVDQLERMLTKRPIRAVYLTPHHQYPTTVTLSPARRARLLELAARHRFAIFEDDYDFEFHYEGRPILPLASADRAGSVIYLGTLSKILAPGLRLGFLCAPPPLVEALAELRKNNDRQGDHVLERAIAELIDDGEVQRHARRMRRIYRERRDALLEALARHFGAALTVRKPTGGLAVWVKTDGRNVDAWRTRAEARGVWFQTERDFSDVPGPGVRMGFAALTVRQIDEAVRRARAAF